MQYDLLKSAWAHGATPQKSSAELKPLLKENTHPVLKEIRRQLVFEAVAFTVFLAVYYDFFDGDRKPLYANVLLAGALLLAIGHTIFGYLLTRRRMEGHTIRQSLEHRLARLKTYALVSVATRLLAAGCLWGFFASVITFDASRYWLLALLGLTAVVQVTLLYRIWRQRIRRLQDTLAGF